MKVENTHGRYEIADSMKTSIAGGIQVVLLTIASVALHAGEAEAVAAVLIAEAGGETHPLEGMAAVLEVIQNRSEKLGAPSLDIATAGKQFSCLNKMTIEELIRKGRKHRRWKDALKMARKGTLTDLTHGADHYHEEAIRPYWADPKRMTAKVDKHLFYRLGTK